MNVDGSNLTKLIGSSDAAAYSPAWSPDGTKIAFVRESYGAPFPSIYVMNVDGNGETRLTFTSASALDANPKWSPAGSKIAFVRDNDTVSDVYVMNADGTNQLQLTTGGQADELGLAWSPDGTKILFGGGHLRSNPEIYVINADGSNKQDLTNNAGYDYVGDWQPLYISASNPIDDPPFFVRQHYDDFLSREPDSSGYAFWTNEITSCGSDAKCTDAKRINVSAAYFLSIEFQETGYLIYCFYNSALNRTNSLPRFIEFMRDTQRVGDGVIVNATGWQQQLEQNKQAFAQEFVARLEFTALYPETMSLA